MSSAVADGRPVVLIGGSPAWLAPWFAPTANQSILEVILPPGQGRNQTVSVQVAGQTSTDAALYTYQRPSLQSISPGSGPTSGTWVNGTAINVTLIGTSLGAFGSVEFRPVLADEQWLGVVTVPAASILVHTDTVMVFRMPEGAGRSLRVVAIIGGQESVENITFAYDPPTVDSIMRADKTAAECAPINSTIHVAPNSSITITRPAGCYRTSGMYQLSIKARRLAPACHPLWSALIRLRSCHTVIISLL